MLNPAAVAGPDAVISRRNPVAKLVCDAVLSVTVLASTDWLTPTLAGLLVLLAAAVTGVRWGALVRRLRLVLPAAGAVLVLSAVFTSTKTGAVWLDIGPILITESSAASGVALAVRVLAVAGAAVIVFGTTDPTDLADSLIQQWRLSPRFAIGSLAALRMLPLLGRQWQLITMARRARGLDAGANPIARLRLFASTMFALLVGAVRQGTGLATAMDARGFDSGLPRSSARRQRITAADVVLMVVTVAGCAAVVAVSVATGHFRSIL